MAIDASEITINVFYNSTKIGSMIVFTVTLQPIWRTTQPPLFSLTQLHKKRWDSPTAYAWRNSDVLSVIVKNISLE